MGTHPIFESDFDCLTENHASSCAAIRHDHQSNGLRERRSLLDFVSILKISCNPDQTL